MFALSNSSLRNLCVRDLSSNSCLQRTPPQASSLPSRPAAPGSLLYATICDCTRLVQKTMHCTSHQSGPLLDGRCPSSPPCALHRVRLACLCALQVSCLMLARRPLPQAFSVVITYVVYLTGKACYLRQNPCFTECTIEANLLSGSQYNCGAFCITYGPPPNALCTSNSICPTLPERLS